MKKRRKSKKARLEKTGFMTQARRVYPPFVIYSVIATAAVIASAELRSLISWRALAVSFLTISILVFSGDGAEQTKQYLKSFFGDRRKTVISAVILVIVVGGAHFGMAIVELGILAYGSLVILMGKDTATPFVMTLISLTVCMIAGVIGHRFLLHIMAIYVFYFMLITSLLSVRLQFLSGSENGVNSP